MKKTILGVLVLILLAGGVIYLWQKSTLQSTSGISEITAEEVVEKYVKYTLGTPANYDLAKQYLNSELQYKFGTTSGFVPRSYGIQDIPYRTIVTTKKVSENQTIIQVIGQYNNSKVIWEFTVNVYNNEWKISAISRI